ncbi:hypothetical protein DWB68_03965 [Galactobacter valiniphilus]|uniref:Nuclease SbcCD subunit C n=1 Tax=Galactobacter valiniphilus TaxID=2676122 RepID=A0A399JGC7_9MICC|nr:SbcC/MukB-like Walker B domain-containing protein [Galactobacter valiniphilus]RII43192.1 hypothetical protein DWB68_03965 [Galactobacter valiniphilus]
MTEIPLFAGFSDASAQWRAERLQLVNWGGFHGHHEVELSRGATLISGASGTGKSTLLDAYLALMMPSTVPFNGASNDATSGRARGADQRNVLSYLRGKRDTTREGESLTDQVLRGDGVPVWGGIALTFLDDMKRRFTAVRLYLADASARTSSDVQMRLFTRPEAVSLAEFEPFAERRFDPRALRSALPGLVYHDTALKFTETLTTRLGIGANGNGDNALRLLARIQAGHQVRTVDSLYKQMVLEEPATFRAAERAVEQYSSLDRAYRDLEQDGAKARALAQIDAAHAAYSGALERAERLDRYGVRQEGTQTGFSLWSLLTHRRLLLEAEGSNRAQREGVTTSLLTAEAGKASLEIDLHEVEEQLRAAGGGALNLLESKLDGALAQAASVSRSRARFTELTAPLGLPCSTAVEFTALVEESSRFADGVDVEREEIGARRDAKVAAAPALKERRTELLREFESLRGRASRVPMAHDAARRQIAEASGLPVAQLPFAAELMDVAPGQEAWRPAAELTLRGVGLTLLVDEREQARLRTAIDGLQLDVRLHFEGVALGEPAPAEAEARMLSSRLVFKDSPFTSWVRERVQRPGIDHVCVSTPEELGGSEPKVTMSGQTSRGRAGAHGRVAGREDVLGFSNADRVQAIKEAAASLTARLVALDTERSGLDAELVTLREREAAFAAVATHTWEQIDLAGAHERVDALRHEIAEMVQRNDALAPLRARHAELKAAVETAKHEYWALDAKLKALDTEWGELAEAQDRINDQLDAAPAEAFLSEADTAELDAILFERDAEVTPARLPAVVRSLRSVLTEESNRSAAEARREAEHLRGIFEAYNERWPDPDRGADVAAYPDFKAIADDIERHGLHQRREAFQRQFQAWSGQDLRLLSDAYDVAMDDIDERLEPVNHILASLPFGPGRDRLSIVVRRLRRRELEEFRATLRELSAVADQEGGSPEAAQASFAQLRELMTLLSATEGAAAVRRDELLDVRKHLEITASKVDTAGRELSTYSSLGGKSGGESQELVAFIVGSALRYQLGDETRTRPRFAPVFLDEGFVKSDAEFAGRAVAAWKGLGFQLIVGAPLDKVTALEPHMDLNLSVTKDQATGYSYVTAFHDAAAPGEELPAGE